MTSFNMGGFRVVGVLALGLALVCAVRADNMTCTDWSKDHCKTDSSTGVTTLACHGEGEVGGTSSDMLYMTGSFSVDIKFQKGDTRGICTAFYLIDTKTHSNKDPDHLEIDLEFYGGEDPSQIFLATNVFWGGQQSLAQHNLTFDPSEDFHTYSVQWNYYRITWFVDNVPVRVLERGKADSWPIKPLKVMSTVWQITWGKDKPDFSNGPIQSYFKNWSLQGCAYQSADGPFDGCPSYHRSTVPWYHYLTDEQDSVLRGSSDGALNYGTLRNSWGWTPA